ncbi:MAG TPA: beta-ketoacyl synthase chain length factor [Dokdonella sp.]
MDDLVVHVEGIGWWSPGLPDWPSAAAALRAGAVPDAAGAPPPASVLAPNERRRAPEPVRLACEVAAQACAMAERDAAALPCVFASAQGDVGTTDAMCAALAAAPRDLSPTLFHNSVHNAAAGYWTVATQCRSASTAISAGRGSFAAGLLEAAVETHAEARPVLLAVYDVAVRGVLADVLDGAAAFGAALVLNGERGPHACASLRLRHEAGAAAADDALPAALRPLAASNPSAAALPLFVALARAEPARVRLPAGRDASLAIELLA